MGTRAVTQLNSKNDFIKHYTRWDGFVPEIKTHIKNLSTDWGDTLDVFRKGLDYNSPSIDVMVEWADNFEQMIKDYESTHSIELMSNLLCLKSFVHHYVMWKDHYAHDEKVDLSVEYKDDRFVFSKRLPKLKPKKIDSEYKILRVQSLDIDKKEISEQFIDFKYKNITEFELLFGFLSLPIFLRDFYTVTKKPANEIYSDGRILSLILSKLSKFYKPTEAYDRFYFANEKKKDGPRDDVQKYKDFTDVLRNAESMIPFDFCIGKLGMHLAFRFPNKIFPVTEAEKLSDLVPDIKILMTETQLSHIFANVKDKSFDDLTEIVNDVSLYYETANQAYSDYYQVDSMYGDVSFVSYKNYVGLNYEESLSRMMHSQYELEIKN